MASISLKQLQQAQDLVRQQGWQARDANRSRDENPFPKDDPSWHHWCEGWDQAAAAAIKHHESLARPR